jgi:hypothetical protein
MMIYHSGNGLQYCNYEDIFETKNSFYILYILYMVYMLYSYVCVFYLLGLPVQVRDAALKIQDQMPKSDVNKEYYTQNMEREVSI